MTCNCSDILDQRHHHNSRGEKVFTFSSLLSFSYCAVTMDNLHHLTHIACARKYRGLRQKLDPLRVQNGQSLSKYQGFIRKLVCYKGISIFLNLFELHSFSVFKMHYSKPHHQFQPFLASFVIFMHLLIFLSYMTLKTKSTTNEL